MIRTLTLLIAFSSQNLQSSLSAPLYALAAPLVVRPLTADQSNQCVQVWILLIAVLTATGHNPVTQWNALASPQQLYFGRVFSLSSTRFNSSSFCPASPSLPSAVRRW